jgi:hypothetical protein
MKARAITTHKFKSGTESVTQNSPISEGVMAMKALYRFRLGFTSAPALVGTAYAQVPATNDMSDVPSNTDSASPCMHGRRECPMSLFQR